MHLRRIIIKFENFEIKKRNLKEISYKNFV